MRTQREPIHDVAPGDVAKAWEKRRRAVVSELAGRELLCRAAQGLATEGIVPVALKGVLLSALASAWGAPPRPMLDVDLLVRRRERDAAERAMRRLGLAEWARSDVATCFHDARTALGIDLHVALCMRGLFHLDADRFALDAVDDTALFGVRVRVPERHDLYAHLVAHFATGRSNATDTRRLDDLATVARALPMTPTAVAARLEAAGLRRAAMYMLGLAARRGDAFAASVRDELASDWIGEGLVRLVEPWLARWPEGARLAVPAPHLLNASLPAGAWSLATHAGRAAARSVRDRARKAG